MGSAIGTIGNAVSGERNEEYMVVTEAQWSDIKAVFQERETKKKGEGKDGTHQM